MKTIQILLTADNHLDPPAYSFGYKRFERRRDHLRCFEEAVNYAKRNRPDLFLIGGDLFDTVRPSNLARAEVMRLFRELYLAGVRIFAVSGHHDTPKSLEEGASPLATYGSSEYVTFLQDPMDPSPYTLKVGGQDLAVFGVSHDHRLGPDHDPLSRLRFMPTEGPSVLITHYPIEGFHGYAGGEPGIRLTSIPGFINLVASGHFHSHQTRRMGETTIVYPGSTERASFAEEGEEKGFVWAELGSDGGVTTEFLRTSARPMKTLELDFPPMENPVKILAQQVKTHIDPQLIMRLRLKGRVSIERLSRYRRIELITDVERDFFHFSVDEEQLFIESQRPVDPLPRATPLSELRRYFDSLILESRDEREILEEARRLSEERLEEEGVT